MSRVMVLLLLFTASSRAQDGFAQALEEARQSIWRMPIWATWEERLNRQYEKLGAVGVQHPDRWEVYFEIGLNRCKRVFFARGEAEAFMTRIRAEGASEEEVKVKQEGAKYMFGVWLDEARQNFEKMKFRMRQRREWDADRVLFAEAAIRFAARQYLGEGRKKGAIDYFRELIRRNYLPEVCATHIGMAYLDLGYEALLEEKYEEAHRYWDEGLKWAKRPALRQMLYTNKAGAYEMDNEYQYAEEVLRTQIEKQPYRPLHEKNLALVLGYQGRLKEALVHYRRARALCRKSPAAARLSLLHGNAWMRAATIHGTLLEKDGDVLLAWRLFLEYRKMFGDDYNFCLWFGDFAVAQRQYDLAWTFLDRARELQPHCTVSYQKLTHIAYRTAGTREEVEARVAEAKKALAEAQRNYLVREETPAVKRLCGGLGDLGDIGARPARRPLLVPDPLAGYTPANPPAWVKEAAAARDPFVPWRPDRDAPGATAAADAGGPGVEVGGIAWGRIAGVAGAVVVLAAAAFLILRRRAPAA